MAKNRCSTRNLILNLTLTGTRKTIILYDEINETRVIKLKILWLELNIIIVNLNLLLTGNS